MTIDEIRNLDIYIHTVYNKYLHDPMFQELVGFPLNRPIELPLWLLKVLQYEQLLEARSKDAKLDRP